MYADFVGAQVRIRNISGIAAKLILAHSMQPQASNYSARSVSRGEIKLALNAGISPRGQHRYSEGQDGSQHHDGVVWTHAVELSSQELERQAGPAGREMRIALSGAWLRRPPPIPSAPPNNESRMLSRRGSLITRET